MKVKSKIFFTLFAAGVFCCTAAGQDQQCPAIDLVLPPGPIVTEHPLAARAKLADISDDRELVFHWTLSEGTLVSGNGTPVIEFRAEEGDESKNIRVSLRIQGLPAGCGENAEGTVPVAAEIIGEPCDEFDNLSPDETRSQLDSYFACLEQNSSSDGFVEVIFDSKESGSKRRAQLELMVRHMDLRKFDKSRITFGLTVGPFARTVLWTSPAGSKLPKSRSGKYKRITNETHKIVRADKFDRKTIKTLLDL